MPELDVKPAAEPSAAPTQYDGWDEKGTPIVTQKTDEPVKQDSAPAETKPEAKAESAAEAGAAKKSQEKKKLNAEERIAQLEATIQKIRESKGTAETKADPSPATTAQGGERKADAQPAALEAPKEPMEAEYDGSPGKTYEDFRKAERKYYSDLAEYKAQKALADFRQQQAQEALRAEMSKRLEEAGKRYPDAKEKIVPTANAIYGDEKIPGTVKMMIDRSDVLADLLYTLNGELDAFVELAKSDPAAALEKVVVTQHLIREELKGKAKPAEARPDKEPPAPEKRAPKPVSEVGGRGLTTEDESVSAARSGDFSAFEKAEWRRKQARS